MSRLLCALLTALLASPALARTTRESLVHRLDESVRQDPYLVAEAFSFATACGLRESRFYDPSRNVRPVRRAAESWWIGMLFDLNEHDSALSCNREVLFGLLPRPWNAGLVQTLRDHLGGEYGKPALELLALGGLLGALDVTFTPEERFFMAYMDASLARMVDGENPLASHRYQPQLFSREISRLLEGAKAVHEGTAVIWPRASSPFSCATEL